MSTNAKAPEAATTHNFKGLSKKDLLKGLVSWRHAMVKSLIRLFLKRLLLHYEDRIGTTFSKLLSRQIDCTTWLLEAEEEDAA